MMIRVEYLDQVAIVKLDRPVTNALSPELVHELGQKKPWKSSDLPSRRYRSRWPRKPSEPAGGPL